MDLQEHQGFFFWTSVPVLALLHWPDLGGTPAGSLDSDTFGEILPEKKALKSTLWHEKHSIFFNFAMKDWI